MRLECPMPVQTYDAITLGHGGGGKLTQRLITQLLLPSLANCYLNELHDGAVVEFGKSRLAFTTDSFVVSPAFFPGGNIGSLAVNGTANDLAMCGAKPLYLSLALILEEGFPMIQLQTVVEEIRKSCEESRLQIVTGDMKVVERGKGDGIFINTTGIGEVLPYVHISPSRVQPGDKIILSGSIAEHGITIMSLREGLEFESELMSDTASLWPAVEGMLQAGKMNIHVLRDATRGGVASVLNEIAQSAHAGMIIDESTIPVR
ncbi:MAG TPA: hydrogenase expression/formation protein HypE, partial [Acidobacteriota bacterium]|nr:hydrogenase expression/formation protein HypE [Acidobacteriota bacterium]